MRRMDGGWRMLRKCERCPPTGSTSGRGEQGGGRACRAIFGEQRISTVINRRLVSITTRLRLILMTFYLLPSPIHASTSPQPTLSNRQCKPALNCRRNRFSCIHVCMVFLDWRRIDGRGLEPTWTASSYAAHMPHTPAEQCEDRRGKARHGHLMFK